MRILSGIQPSGALHVGNYFGMMRPSVELQDKGWDSENRLTNLTSLSSAPTLSKYKIDLAYDHMGRRIRKIVSTNNGSSFVAQYTNRFVYDGWNLVAVLNASSVLY